MHLAAGLHPDTLGELELERSPRPPSRSWRVISLLLKGRKEEGGIGGKGWKWRGGRVYDLHPTLFLCPGGGLCWDPSHFKMQIK